MSRFSTSTVTRTLLIVALSIGGCATPYAGDDVDQRLQSALEGAISRELAGNQEDPTLQVTPSLHSQVEETLAPRRAELDQIGPAVARGGQPLDLGENLLGGAQEEIFITLREVIETTIENNLLGQNARLAQGISETRIIQAQAAFDAIFFSDFNFTRLQQPQVVPQIEVISPVPPFNRQTQDLSTSVRNVKQWSVETGLRNQLTSGGAIEVSTSIGYDDIADSDGISYSPDPAWNSAITLGITQPLLRGFGSEVALSELRLARNAARASTENLREQLLTLIANAEAAYWQLVLARQKLAASEWLLEVGIAIRDVLAQRRDIDATAANYADAVATVERRRGDLIVAQRDIRYSSDALKVIMNDPGLPVGDETLVAPADWMTDEPMRYNLGEA
ncbi:MAG: TolC family protein, partial [Planctomycetota bacterium]|nr:TolC family protein [Planctomycetota bacterium]